MIGMDPHKRSATITGPASQNSHGGPNSREPPDLDAVFGSYDRVLSVALDDLPEWMPAWCLDHLGGEPVGVLFELQQVSMVFGLRLAGGLDVVIKARADEGRAVSCVAAQARLAERGFPCARPLTPVVGVGSLAVHAEEFRPGGEVLYGDSPDIAVRNAEVFARLMAGLAAVTVGVGPDAEATADEGFDGHTATVHAIPPVAAAA